MFGILYNKISEYRKQSKKNEPSEDIEKIVNSYFDVNGHWILSKAPVSPEKFLENSQLLKIINICIDHLSMNHKVAFVLREIEGEIVENICNIMDVTATHLGVLLYRARNQLRECIDRKSR